jgi:thymidylate synthase (FAD)
MEPFEVKVEGVPEGVRFVEQGCVVEWPWPSAAHGISDMVEAAGRTCYKSEGKASKGSADPFLRGVIKRGHHSVIEHATATVRFVTDRGVTHELVRHRICAFSQESTRYCDYGKAGAVTFVWPVWAPIDRIGEMLDRRTEHFIRGCVESADAYRKALSMGQPAQEARQFLNHSVKTEIVVTANLREWRHIISLRSLGTTGKPHPQMKALMDPVLPRLAELYPWAFDDLLPGT